MWNPQLSPLPPSGICPTSAAAWTPGSACARSSRRCWNATTCASFSYAFPSSESGEREHALRPEAERRLEQAPEALEREARRREQHEREGELGGHEGAASARGGAARALAAVEGERAGESGGRGLERRRDAEEERRSDRQRAGEDQHPRVDPRVVDARQRRGREPDQGGAAETGQGDAERAAGRGEHEALDQELTDQPPAARAEGRPHGHLVPPAQRPREQQVGDVRAGDQEDEADRARQDRERRPHRTRELVAEGNDRHRSGRIVGGVLGSEPAADSIEVFAGLGEGDALFQASDRLQVLAAAAGVRRGRVVAERRPDLGRLVEVRREQRLEGGRHHADDLEVLLVHPDLPADDGGVGAEAPPPERVAQDELAPRVRPVVRRLEAPAERRADAEQVEVVRADPHARDALGLAALRQRRLPEADDRGRLKGARLVAKVGEGRKPDVVGVAFGLPVAEEDEPVRRGVGQRLEERRVEDAEDGRVGADADREGGERDRREPRALSQRPQRVAQVPEDRAHRHSLRSVAIGSSREARRAGSSDAARTVARSSAAAPA